MSDYKPENYENSISFNDDELGVMLQKDQNEAGNTYMQVYMLLDHGQKSNYLFTVTQADLAPYANAHPDHNILLVSRDGISVYILTTGEIQVNAVPDSEGKMHVKILDGIPWTKIYGYTVDPQ